MTARTQGDERKIRGAAALRSVEAAALAGLAHAALSLISTYLLLRAPRPEDGTADVLWYADEANQRSTALGLNLMAIGTIAFLWFVAVIRRRVGERENRFFGTVFLGSALLLAATRIMAGILLAAPAMSAYAFDLTPDANSIGLWQAAGLSMATIVGTRLEAVFVISTTTVGRLSGALPAWGCSSPWPSPAPSGWPSPWWRCGRCWARARSTCWSGKASAPAGRPTSRNS